MNVPNRDLDKRRRNTAASARFRARKKQRQQELERSARDMGRRVQDLETKVRGTIILLNLEPERV